MKTKIIFYFSFFLIFFYGCEYIPNNPIESVSSDLIQIDSLSLPNELLLSINNKYQAKIILSSNRENIIIFANLYDPKYKLIMENLIFQKNLQLNKTVFTAEIKFDSNYINGNYLLEIFVKNKNFQKLLLQKKFYFFNGKENIAPIITDLIFPDTVIVGQYFTFSIKVIDYNGYQDIKRVYFKLYDENGNFLAQDDMRDNGDPIYGDAAANDSVFSYRNFFTSAAANKLRKFEIQAEDFGGLKSVKLSHIVFVKQ